MQSLLSRWLERLFDIREGESQIALQAFAILFLVIGAHTTVETARDALFLTKLPPSQLNVVYVVLAGLTLPVTAASSRLAARFGRRNAFIFSLVVAAYVSTTLYFFAPTPRVALALYIFSGLEGAVLAPQFWLLASQLFTVSQGRRLFGPIASGGVVGGTVGAATAALALRVWPVTALLPLAAFLFAVSALLLTTVRSEDPVAMPVPQVPASTSLGRVFRDNPFLVRIGGLVSVSTAAVLVVDYLFKSTAARLIAPAALGEFFARYYAVLNGISLLVQVLIVGRLVRRLGVVGTVAVMPLLLLGGGAAVLLGGGLLVVVLGLKAVDGGLRYSLNRVATELLYLPLPPEVRDRGKGFVDSSLSRIVQALTAIVLYVLAIRSLATPRVLALIIVVVCAAWVGIAGSLRKSYLDLFRRALAAGGIGPEADIQELDLTSAEALVESMANPDPATVKSAMDVLVLHRRVKLIPALVLYHDDPSVLIRALEIFGASHRLDWIPLAAKLLSHSNESVRIAAVRALAKKGNVEALERAAADASSRVQAYAALHLAHREPGQDLARHPLIAVIMELPGDYGVQSRRGLLAAVCDTPDDRAIDLLIEFAARPEFESDEEAIEQIATAMAAIKSPRFVPTCVARLAKRIGRESVRDALVAIGDPALDELATTLRAEHVERRIRLHVPQSISRFASQRASDILVEELDRETEGLVRYKALRALGALVAANDVKIERVRIERLAARNLEEYLRLLSFRAAMGESATGSRADAGTALLTGLIADKLGQSLERAFRLLKIAHKREDIHRVHKAAASSDKRARARAGEFLDALLARRDQQDIREALRIVVDEASDVVRVRRAGSTGGRVLAQSREQALAMLVDDRDDALAALAGHVALALNDATLRAAVARASDRRPSLRALAEHLFGAPMKVVGVAGG
jgi:AAA family ATP:ADP antiporter